MFGTQKEIDFWKEREWNSQVELSAAKEHGAWVNREYEKELVQKNNRIKELESRLATAKIELLDFGKRLDEKMSRHNKAALEAAAEIADLKFKLNPPKSNKYEITYHDNAQQIIKATSYGIGQYGNTYAFIRETSPTTNILVAEINTIDLRSIVAL